VDQKTKEKIEKYHGLDFCKHHRQRMFCPNCMWEVPAIFRKKHEKYLKENFPAGVPLTILSENIRLI